MISKRAIAGWIYLGITTTGGFVTLAAASRFLDPAAAGIWFTMQAASAFLLLLDFGGGYALMREISRSIGERGNHQNAQNKFAFSSPDRAVIAKVVAANLAASALVGLGLLVYFSRYAPPGEEASAPIAWILYFVAGLINVFTLPRRSYLEAVGELHLERNAASVGHLAATVLLLAATIGSGSLILMAGSVLGGAVITFTLVTRLSRRKQEGAVEEGIITLSAGELAKTSVGFLWVNAGAVATRSAYTLVVTALLGSAQLAPLYFGMKLFGMVSTAIGIVTISERSDFAKLFASGSMSTARQAFRKLMMWNVGSAFFAGLGLILLAGEFSTRLSGREYRLSDNLYMILALDFFLTALTASCAHIVMASGTNPFKLSVFGAGIITVALLFLLVPRYGIMGAALAPLIANSLTSFWYNPWCAFKLFRKVV